MGLPFEPLSPEELLLRAIFGEDREGLPVKVKVNTVDSGHLCTTCRSAQIIKDVSSNLEYTMCHYYGERWVVPFKVKECTVYTDRTTPTVHDLEEIAWILRTDPNRKVIGFRPPKKDKEEDND